MPCLLDHGGVVPCSGTSFAAPFVCGPAALVRSRFRHLTAPQVGFGMINPVAVLTAPPRGTGLQSGAQRRRGGPGWGNSPPTLANVAPKSSSRT
jgi:hypothetical protein